MEPRATRVSIFGALCHRLLKPLMKNFWLMTITMAVKINWISPIATWFPSKNAGSGQPHIICPMEKYMRTIRNPTEYQSLRFKTGVSWSFNASSASKDCACTLPSFPAPFTDAPYPASCTALMISADDAVPSTPMELVSRLTEQAVTPGTPETAFSTRLLQAAQLMPVTIYCSILLSFPPFSIPPATASSQLHSSLPCPEYCFLIRLA